MNGKIYPLDGSPRCLKSNGETLVYEALRRHLPEGWTAWHSLRLRIGTRWEGEGDFVIAVPRRGLLVIEVKSGRIECHDGRWLQNGRPMDPPREQAQGFARHLAGAIQARGIEPPPYGDACAFPQTEFSEAPRAGDLKGLVIGARDLAWLDEKLAQVFEAAVPKWGAPAGDRWIRVLHDLWGETWAPHVRLTDRIEDAARRAIALNAEQLAILDCVETSPRALVEGGAGTGKTVVARELARRWAVRGKRVLYLCFTDALAHAIDHSFAAERAAGADVRAATVRRHACDLLDGAGAVLDLEEKSFWEDVAFRAACEALPGNARPPDLVVVDEAQDPSAGDWALIETLAAGRALWAFWDRGQRFWAERRPPEALFAGAMRLVLREQQRNPPSIAAFASLYTETPTPLSTGGLDPEVLRLAVVRPGRLLEGVLGELDSFALRGARPNDIAIISLAGQTKSGLLKLDRLGTRRLVRADAAGAAVETVADTFLRFKGLDRPFVILAELEQGESTRYDTRMHIALTRAAVAAVVVCGEEMLACDERLLALPRGTAER